MNLDFIIIFHTNQSPIVSKLTRIVNNYINRTIVTVFTRNRSSRHPFTHSQTPSLFDTTTAAAGETHRRQRRTKHTTGSFLRRVSPPKTGTA
ncbi:hypothetical protein HanPI659440_Chr04g0142361 [Helianthus annuus]|nr:hypothetical protein HanPI659440_Chr04g0142361 [Helianthus annuus]